MSVQIKNILELYKLLKSAFGDYQWQIALMIFLTVFSGVLEGVGINAIIPLFSLIDKNQPETTDIISRTIKNLFFYFNLELTIKYLLIFIALLFIFKAVSLFINQFISLVIIADYQKRVRSELWKLFIHTRWQYLSKQKIGHLDQILIQNVTDSARLFSRISSGLLIAVNLIIYSLLVINVSSWIALLALIFGILTLFLLKPIFYRARIISHQIVQEVKEVAHYLNENIIGGKSIKTMFAEEAVFKDGLNHFIELKNLQVRVGWPSGLTQALPQLAGIFFIIAIFTFLYKGEIWNYASFVISIYAINKIFTNAQLVQSEIYGWNTCIPSLLSVLKFRDEVFKNQEIDSGKRGFVFERRLEFKKVAFYYEKDGGEPVLSNVNFAIKKGETVGLIGSSGAGKTTIIDLLLRLLKPTQGKIEIDGLDISEISLRDWRTNIGYVSQDIFLINDTILSNIKFYDDGISFEEVVSAAKMANIYEFINSLPRKFETMVGERGIQLSVGQRQRIVLARIFARKPKILILDEATSALDNESEALIQKSLEGLRGKITVIAIAHRLSTLLNFDQILVLSGGEISEQGSPQALLGNPQSYFYRLYHLKE